jgi:predicted molibdopterin-dependent oxidoreductase YjgC
MVEIVIDGNRLEVEEGRTVLEAARDAGIPIPALCWHPALKPVGACKVCVVEVAGREGPTVKPSCLLKVSPGLSVRTASPLAIEARTRAFADLLLMAPQAEKIIDLARRHGIVLPPAPDNCIRCRLCVRVCRDVVGAGALIMEKRGDRMYVAAVEDRCIGCGTCANICPTDCIKVEDVDDIRTVSIRDELIGRHVLLRCETCGRRFATEKFLTRVSHLSTECHPDVKEHHRRCPTCAKIFAPKVEVSTRQKL